MPDGLLTLLDIAKQRVGSDAEALIDETAQAVPEISGIHPTTGQRIVGVAEARTIQGTHYETSVLVELPTISFRDVNQGTKPTKSRREKRVVGCMVTTPKWGVDKMAPTLDDSIGDLLANEADAHLAAYWQLLGRCFYYGTDVNFGGGEKAFPALLQSYDYDNMTVDATGTTADKCSSVWGVKFGAQSVRWVSGMNGMHNITDPRIGDMKDADGKEFTGYIQELEAKPGLQVGTKQQVARIKNITTAKGLTGDMLGELVNKFKVGMRPDALFLTKRSLEQYRQNIQAVTSAPGRIPTPTEFEGIQLVPTENLKDTEPVNLKSAA